jgi:hypothetical protein
MTNLPDFIVVVANESHIGYAQTICDEMEASAKARGTGIAKRKPEYVALKMTEGKAVIALHPDGKWASFCYIETWGHGKYVANSGLIVSPELRKSGLARQIKQKVFELSRTKYPDAKIFGLTTALAVMKINSGLGYKPVTYSELTDDEAFWKGCQSCVNFEILQSKNRSNCLCTAMLFDPAQESTFMALPVVEQKPAKTASSLQERWVRYRQRLALQPITLPEQEKDKNKKAS